MTNNTNFFLKLLISSLFLFSCNQKKKEPEVQTLESKKQNILFIAVDDLRPELNCYGKTQIISPNIDAIASEGTIYNNAYVTVPVCGASRASLLTGIHPTKNRFIDYGSRVDEEAKGLTTLPGQFKKNGYYTTSVGKIFHHPDDGLAGWSEPPVRPDYPNSLGQQELWRDYQSEENAYTKKDKLPLGATGPAWEAADVPDDTYYDGKTANLAVAKLNELANLKQPFFFGVGFIRPHLPFNAPKKYWDLYDRENIKLSTIDSMPKNAPLQSWHNYGELRSYTNIPNDTLPISSEKAISLRHGYYACVSYIDAQIGKVISELKRLNLYENTTIVLWGDHGWSLGEHTLWCKQSVYTKATKTPLIVKTSNQTAKGISNSLVSFIDIYPTLCDLTGIEKPKHLAGKSFANTLSEPNTQNNKYVYWRWQNGETIKSNQYVYTRYVNNQGEFLSHMLYDHNNDPDETKNLAVSKEYKNVVEELQEALDKHIKERS